MACCPFNNDNLFGNHIDDQVLKTKLNEIQNTSSNAAISNVGNQLTVSNQVYMVMNDSFGEMAESSAGTFDVHMKNQGHQTSSVIRDSQTI